MSDSITNLINTYHELNASVVDELREEPSALEFMRYVAKNRPFVVRQTATAWKAYDKWSADYLRAAMGEDENVVRAATRVAQAHGGRNADAVVQQEDGTLVFVEPHETFEPFGDFLHAVQRSPAGLVRYAQTQNDNLRNEYSALSSDVPADIPFARIALGQTADAINLWLGNDRSTTALHKDNYENIYVQVRGRKHFVLMPPVEMPCVSERMMRKGRYGPVASAGDDGTGGASEEGDGELTAQLDQDAESVPVAIWDPEEPEGRTTTYSHLAKPLRVTLREGDMLYLPSMWYHKVSQSIGDEGFVCAVNYWYDMDFAGNHWASTSFIRDVYHAEQMKPKYPELKLGDGPG